jgi:hypothetical protein
VQLSRPPRLVSALPRLIWMPAHWSGARSRLLSLRASRKAVTASSRRAVPLSRSPSFVSAVAEIVQRRPALLCVLPEVKRKAGDLRRDDEIEFDPLVAPTHIECVLSLAHNVEAGGGVVAQSCSYRPTRANAPLQAAAHLHRCLQIARRVGDRPYSPENGRWRSLAGPASRLATLLGVF